MPSSTTILLGHRRCLNPQNSPAVSTPDFRSKKYPISADCKSPGLFRQSAAKHLTLIEEGRPAPWLPCPPIPKILEGTAPSCILERGRWDFHGKRKALRVLWRRFHSRSPSPTQDSLRKARLPQEAQTSGRRDMAAQQ